MITEPNAAPEWDGEHVFGEGWFAFRGRAHDNAFHDHAARQVTVGTQGPVWIEEPTGAIHESNGLLVASGKKHRLLPSLSVVLVLVDPGVTLSLDSHMTADGTITPLPDDVADLLSASGSLEDIVERGLAPRRRETQDRRVGAALHSLTEGTAGSLDELSREVGLSPARLRNLVRESLGVPLSKVQHMRRLTRAAEAIAAGSSLADAAALAGFADQAHMTRTFKAALGITPKTATKPLR